MMSLEHRNLIHADLGHVFERAIRQAILHDGLHSPEHTSPTCFEDPGCFAPGKTPGPSGQEELVSGGHPFLPFCPGHPLDLHAIEGGSRRVSEDHPAVPDRKMFEFPDRLGIVDGVASDRTPDIPAGLFFRGRISTQRTGFS